MTRKYEAPALEEYGRLEALTSSWIKCTPGGDSGYTMYGHSNGKIYDQNGNELDIDRDRCLPPVTWP